MPRSDRMDRRRFLARALRYGAAACVLPSIPGWARAARFAETSRAWRAMGTLLEVRVPDLSPADAVEAIRRVRARVAELEAALTLFRPESPLVAGNAAPEGRWLPVPRDLAAAAAWAREAHDASGGAYDPTVAPAMRAWGLYDLEGRVPSAKTLAAWRHRPSPAAIEIDASGGRMRRLDARVELDLGGIGKGIAVDAALAELRRAGSRAALVNFGGEIGVLGAPEDDPEGWPVGIAHPRRPGEVWTELRLAAGHVATSGDYERVVATAAGRKHHLLDPQTGEPTFGVASLTVWAASGREADTASTALFVAASRGEPLPGTRRHLVIRDANGRLTTG